MGLFSSIVSGISSVVSKAASGIKEAFTTIVESPRRPTFLPTIGDVLEKVADFIFGKRYSSSTASAEETKDMNRELARYAKTFHAEANRVEEELLEQANSYFDKVISQLEDMQTVDVFMRELPLKKIKGEIQNLRKELRGGMKNHISHAYSLDNPELLRILELKSDNDRVKEMEQYAKRVMKQAVEQYLEKIEELSETQMEMVQDLILSKVDQITLTMKAEQDLLHELQAAKQQDEKDLEELKYRISGTLEICNLSIEELRTA